MLSRSDDSVFGKWWWTVDKPLLFSFVLVIAIGILLAVAATPMVANKIGLEKFYFLKRHLLYVTPSLMIIFGISTLKTKHLLWGAVLLFTAAVLLTIATLFLGTEIKGARRWISLGGFSMQPSEFAKPALVVLTAWLFAEQQKDKNFRGKLFATILLCFFAAILVMQPDIGMLVVTSLVWFGQLFLNGLPLFFVIIATILCIGGGVLAYLFLPHVTTRVDKFLDPEVGDHYQINMSLDAFSHGGFFGVGPGEGLVKKHLPDAHSDFVFSVLGEEFGFFVCVFVVLLICFIVIYGMFKTIKEDSIFRILSSVGLLAQFGAQSFINMASTLHMIPTKGMTLPFMSYGGSSMMAISISVGMILAFTKRRSNILT